MIQVSIDVERNPYPLRDRILAMAPDQRERDPMHHVAEQDGAADKKDREDPMMMNADCTGARLHCKKGCRKDFLRSNFNCHFQEHLTADGEGNVA